MRIRNSEVKAQAMKEYDRVKVIRDSERYKKAGIVKGMVGTILDPRKIDGRWLVIFSDAHGNDIAEDSMLESDLEVVE